MRKNLSLVLIFVFLSMVLTACGFQLRGALDLPPLYDRVLIVDKGAAEVVAPLKKALKENNVQLVDSPAAASAVISLLSQGVGRRAVAIRGQDVREYELQISISFVVQDLRTEKGQAVKQVGEAQTVTSVRRYSYNSSQVLGSDNEESILVNEMRQDLVQQIMRRLSKLYR